MSGALLRPDFDHLNLCTQVLLNRVLALTRRFNSLGGLDSDSVAERRYRGGLVTRSEGRLPRCKSFFQPGRNAVTQTAQGGFTLAVARRGIAEARVAICRVALLRQRRCGIELRFGPVLSLALLQLVLQGEEGVQCGLGRCALAISLRLLPR
jgi:hypothetical protein